MNMFIIIGVIMIVVVIFAAQNQVKGKKAPKEEDINEEYSLDFYPYKRKYLLTKSEWTFYRKLKALADTYNYNIITKIRLADIVEVDGSRTDEYFKYFGKIKSKHIDFALVCPENMAIKYLIELDDYTHNYKNRIQRDTFVNNLCEEVGYKLLRTYGNLSEIENILKQDSTAMA